MYRSRRHPVGPRAILGNHPFRYSLIRACLTCCRLEYLSQCFGLASAVLISFTEVNPTALPSLPLRVLHAFLAASLLFLFRSFSLLVSHALSATCRPLLGASVTSS